MLTEYACGHIGKVAEGRKAKAFILVAEIRNASVDDSPKKCPDCQASHA